MPRPPTPKLQQITRSRPIKFVWLIGDTRPGTGVPTYFRPAKVNVLFGSSEEIATDLPYADLDGDDLPDMAIGRLPAKMSANWKSISLE